MLLERLDLRREEIARVEGVVAHELVDRAVKLVRPRAGDDARRRAGGAAVFRRRGLREDAELGDRLDRQLERIAAVHAVLVLRAVDEVHVLLGPHAVDGVRLSLAQAAAGGRDPGGQRRDAGLQQSELREVAAVERQIDQLAAGDDAAERVAGGVDELRAAGDLHRFGDRRSSSCALTRTLWLTLTSMASRTSVAKPGACTVTLYFPTGSSRMR